MKIVQYMLGIRNADGGVVRAVVDLSALLAQAGHQVIALTVDDRDAPRDWNGSNGKPLLQTLTASSMLPVRLSRQSLVQAQQAFQGADAIHLHVPWDPICAQLAPVAIRMGIPYFITIHGMLDDWTVTQKALKKKLYLALFGRKLLERAAWVHCCAEIEREQSSKRYPRGRSFVAPLPFDLSPFEQLPGPEPAQRLWPQRDGAFTALAVGRLNPIKRLELLIEAGALLQKRGVEIDIVIAGSGDHSYEKSLHQLAALRGMRERVHFPGFVTGQDKLALYQATDVVVHASAHENFGYVTVESLACRTPVITTKAVNIWPELQQSGGAVIVEENADSIAEALAALRQDQSRIDQMGQAGRAWVFNSLEPQRIVRLYEQMYGNR